MPKFALRVNPKCPNEWVFRIEHCRAQLTNLCFLQLLMGEKISLVNCGIFHAVLSTRTYLLRLNCNHALRRHRNCRVSEAAERFRFAEGDRPARGRQRT